MTDRVTTVTRTGIGTATTALTPTWGASHRSAEPLDAASFFFNAFDPARSGPRCVSNRYGTTTPWPQAHYARVGASRTRARSLRYRVAKRRAIALLESHLSKTQLATWKERRYFEVVSSEGRTWRIVSQEDTNVVLVDEGEGFPVSWRGRVVGRGAYMCGGIARNGVIPMEDNLLAQKLLLESPPGEAFYLLVAN